MKPRILQFPANVVLLFGVLGIVFACIGGGMILHTRAFIAKAERVPGRVVALERGHEGVFPVFAYSTADDEELRFRGTIASSPPAYRIGEEVEVYYVPETPYDAKVVGWLELWGLSGAFVAFGLLMMPLLYVAWRIR